MTEKIEEPQSKTGDIFVHLDSVGANNATIRFSIFDDDKEIYTPTAITIPVGMSISDKNIIGGLR